jgi:hypothetical protein
LQILPRYALAKRDIALGDQNIDGIQLGGFGRCGGRRLVIATPGEQRRDSASGDGDNEDNKTRGFHTLHFPQ